MFWSLMIVVSLKYVMLIMRADNRGEGGIMALIALATDAIRDQPHWRLPLLVIGVFGASLFYGDAVMTPAISVLSAVEGLEVGTEALKPFVVPDRGRRAGRRCSRCSRAAARRSARCSGR